MFLVFHLKPTLPDAYIAARTAQQAKAFWSRDPAVATLGYYSPVALVNVPTLAEVFGATNHIDQDWRTNDSVMPLRPLSVCERSTSVGDIVLECETGQLHLCAPCGWEAITWPLIDAATGAHLRAALFAATATTEG